MKKQKPAYPSEQEALAVGVEMFIHSYLHSRRQKEIGQRYLVGQTPCVHYEFEWEGRWIVADNFFIWPQSLAEAMPAIRTGRPAADHQIFFVGPDPIDEWEDCFSTGVNYLMIYRPGKNSPPRPEDAPHVYRATPEDADLLANLDGDNAVPAWDLEDQSMAYYYILEDDRPATIGRVVEFAPGRVWISNVYTSHHHRQKGYASALVYAMLQDYQATPYLMLLSTPAAHHIYKKYSFQDLAVVTTLQLSVLDGA